MNFPSPINLQAAAGEHSTFEGVSRVPFWAYTDAGLYQRELDRIFYGAHWCYVGLAIEIPKLGDFKLSSVGERQVIMVRDRVAPNPPAEFCWRPGRRSLPMVPMTPLRPALRGA